MNFKILFLFTLIPVFQFAQTKDASYIKSIQVIGSNQKFSRTTHALNTSFTFSFDDTNGTRDEYYYYIKHCNLDWSPSNLPSSYYINGFKNMQINNVENSFGTLQNYTHYTFDIPNENTTITKSGNYLFQILNVDDEVVCERKVIIYDQKVSINLKTSQSRDLTLFNEKQAVSMVINNNQLSINYPDKEIKTFIYQNGDLQTKTPFLTPTFTTSSTLTYRPTKKTEFIAGNEFYYFDNNEILKNTRFVSTSYREDNTYNTILLTQKSRAQLPYTYNPDINGDYLIRNYNTDTPQIEAEYSNVLFSLQNDIDYNGKDIYIYGAFNNYQFTEENLMHLDSTGQYLTASLFLKQGFYNYDFVTIDQHQLNKKIVSGSFFQTENNYEALVYLTPLNSIYYEVVGYGIANSKQQIEN